MLKGHVFSEQTFDVKMFALFINQFLGGNNGIIQSYKNAMAMTNTANSITIGTGAVVVQGRFLEEHTETTVNFAKTEALYCSLVLEIDLGQTNTTTVLNQAQYKVLENSSDYPTLIQNDIINQTGNIYQFELARFQNGPTGIVNFIDRRNYLNFDSIYAGIIQNNLTSSSTTSALSANQGKILNDRLSCKPILDCNDTSLPTGWYYGSDTLNTANIPYASGWNINIIKSYSDRITQVAYRYRDNEIYERQYNSINAAGTGFDDTAWWKPWVRIDPIEKIVTGQEVATNEYRNGKQVFEKLLVFTTEILTPSTTIAHGITGYDQIWVDKGNSFFKSGSTFITLPNIFYSSTTRDAIDVLVLGFNLKFISDTSWSTAWIKNILIKYTKNS